MAKATARGRAKRRPAQRSAKAGQGGFHGWAVLGVIALGGILAYEHWGRPDAAALALAQSIVHPTAQTAAVPRKLVPPQPVERSMAQPAERAVVLPVAMPRVPMPGDKPEVEPVVPGKFTTKFGFCGQGKPFNCIIDGGSFWHRGTKIRLADATVADIDKPACPQERQTGVAAKARLLKLLNAGPFTVKPGDRDADATGSKLRLIDRDGQSFGMTLIREGLAHPPGDRRPWC